MDTKHVLSITGRCLRMRSCTESERTSWIRAHWFSRACQIPARKASGRSAPSVAFMTVDEDANEFLISGDFGKEQGSVFLGGPGGPGQVVVS